MEWAFWAGAVIIAVTVGGLVWMRNRPLRDARGTIVDEFGRPVEQLSKEAIAVLTALRQSHESLSGYDLRRHVTLSRQEFYAMIADLEFRGFLTSKIMMSGDHNIRRYFLTEAGHDLFEGDTAA